MKHFRAISIIALALTTSGAFAQNHVDSYFTAYKVAAKYPAQFDGWLSENRAYFDSTFLASMDRMQARLWQQAQAEIEMCNQHANPEWRNKCMEENMSASLFFFNISLRAVLAEQTTWANSDRGQLAVYAKNMYNQMGGVQLTGVTWENLFDQAFAIMEPQMRTYVTQLMRP